MKRLLASLLPSDAREHVMGDLAERRFRLRDIASVLPRVWFAHFRRECFGPIPDLTGSSVAQIRARSRQVDRKSKLFGLVWFGLMFWRYNRVGFVKGPNWLNFLVVAILLSFLVWGLVTDYRRKRAIPNTRQAWAEWHGKQLETSIRFQKIFPFMMAPMLVSTLWRLPLLELALFYGIAAACLITVWHWHRRLALELAKLQNEPTSSNGMSSQ